MVVQIRGFKRILVGGDVAKSHPQSKCCEQCSGRVYLTF